MGAISWGAAEGVPGDGGQTMTVPLGSDNLEESIELINEAFRQELEAFRERAAKMADDFEIVEHDGFERADDGQMTLWNLAAAIRAMEIEP